MSSQKSESVMNFFEAEIYKYNRRLEKIRAKPDPTKLQCNALLYEVERDFRKLQLKWWQEGRPFLSGFPLEPLFTAMGFQSVDVGMIGDRVSSDTIKKYFDFIRAKGYPDTVCDRVVVSVPMQILGDLPPLSLSVITNMVCDNIMFLYDVLAKHYDISVYMLDVPFEPTVESLDFVTDQIKDLIKFIQKKIPGARYDEEVMAALQEVDKKAYGCFHDIHELKKRSPCPVNARDGFREERFPSFYCDVELAQKSLRYLEEFRDELYDRADRGVGVMPEENLRIMWTVTGPIHTEAPFRLLQEKGVSIPVYVHGSTARNTMNKYGIYGDETEFGRKLTPLEEQARFVLMNVRTWGGLAGGWESDCIDLCREQNIDALINFLQMGCPQTLGLAVMLENAVREQLGIPTLHLEGRGLDPTSYNAEEFESSLMDFVDMCIANKRAH